MHNVPIFDSLTHPMPLGSWINSDYGGLNKIEYILADMRQNNVGWAFAIGMGEKIGGYKENSYSAYIYNNSDNLFPVAYLDFSQVKACKGGINTYISRIKSLGYVGIKIHPRFSKINIDHIDVVQALRAANKVGLIVFICSYFWGGKETNRTNTPEALERLLDKSPETSMVLLHGGGVRILEYSEVVRAYPNVILDLSFTLCRYQGSSVDLDISYLFHKFDQRICVGSDSPEHTHAELRQRFDHFSKGLDKHKIENIGYKNLKTLINK